MVFQTSTSNKLTSPTAISTIYCLLHATIKLFRLFVFCYYDNFCIPGGRAVIEEIEKQLNLSKELVEPSKASLWRFGNVSSSSIWYILGYIETFKVSVDSMMSTAHSYGRFNACCCMAFYLIVFCLTQLR